MKIAHVISTPQGIGGAERTLLGLIEGGRAVGWDQLVLNPFADAERKSGLQGALPSVAYEALPVDSAADLWAMRDRLRKCLESFRPAVVHAHLFHATVVVATLKLDVPRVMTQQHGSFYANDRRWLRDRVDGWATRRFDRVVTISPHVTDFVVNHHSFPRQRVVEIPNGWSGSPLPREHSGASRTLVSIGNFRAEKGHSVLLKAAARVKVRHPDIRLILVGDGPLRTALEDEAARLGLANIVEFSGWLTDVWEVLASADVFVLPSHSEALGVAALEAMASGVPVVASAVGGLRTLLDHERTGLLVPPGDPQALADALERALEDPGLRSSLAKVAREEADVYRMDRIVDRYADLYRELVT